MAPKRRSQSLQRKRQHLPDSGQVQSVRTVGVWRPSGRIANIALWHRQKVVDGCGIVRHAQEDVRLARAHASVLHADLNHVGECLRDDCSHQAAEAVPRALGFAAFDDIVQVHVIQPFVDVAERNLVWCLVLDDERSRTALFARAVDAELVGPGARRSRRAIAGGR